LFAFTYAQLHTHMDTQMFNGFTDDSLPLSCWCVWWVRLYVASGWFFHTVQADADTASVGSGPHGHSFVIRTFFVPMKCYHCTSLMIGIERQGTFCEGLQSLVLFFPSFFCRTPLPLPF